MTSHTFAVQRAFLRLGWLEIVGYPASFVLQQLTRITSLLSFLLLSQVVADTPALGNDYFTFVSIGTIAHGLMHVGLTGFSQQMDRAIQQGRLEAFLVQPVSWRILPFGMVQFPLIVRAATVCTTVVLAILLGARLDPAGALPALTLLALGLLSVMSIGILATAIKVLTKRSNPILMVYSLMTALVSGVWFPVEVLPGWLQPVAYATPQTYVLSGTRGVLMHDTADLGGTSFGTSVIALLAISAVMYPIALAVYSRTMETGRRLGVLAGY